MNRPSVHVVAGLLSLALAGRAHAADPAPVAESAAPAATREVSAASLAPRPAAHLMSPVVVAMMSAIDEQRAKIARLRAELRAARGTTRELELQRALSSAKRETELRLLRIQADHARREGRIDVAANLEAAIIASTTPPVRREPAARPAPLLDSGR